MGFVRFFFSYQNIIVLLFCSLGCISCFVLQKYGGMPNFLASICVGLAGSFLPETSFWDSKKAIACIYTGSFAAMSSFSLFTRSIDIILLSLLVGCYYIGLGSFFKGFGGKLGSIAFVSVLSFIFIKSIL